VATGAAPTVVITGATSGIGAATAHRFASDGARVVVVARDPARAEAVRASLPGTHPPPVIADLSVLSQVRTAAGAIRDLGLSVDVLINNAGAVFMRREVTSEGHERTLALNVLAPFTLTRLLEPALRSAPHPRVVFVSSAAHYGTHLRFDDLESVHYRGFSVYGRSKLALILVARAFARRHRPEELAFFAVHPGFVRSRFGLNNGGGFSLGMRFLMRIGGIAPATAARTVVFAATSPSLAGRSGDYIAKERIVQASKEASVDADGERLWKVLAAWSGLPP